METVRSKKSIFGLAALASGVVALALAIIPRAYFDVPPPWPTPPQADPIEVEEGGKTFGWKGFKVTLGGKRTVIPPQPTPVPSSSRSVAITTAVVALLGISIGSIACWRERSYKLAGPGMAMCCAALVWHYVLLGVTLAIVILIIFVVLATLGGGV